AGPRKGAIAIFALAEKFLASQTDANEVSPAHSGREADDLLFARAATVKEYQERVGVVGLIARRQERPDRQGAGTKHFGCIKTFFRSERSPRQIGKWHKAPRLGQEYQFCGLQRL